MPNPNFSESEIRRQTAAIALQCTFLRATRTPSAKLQSIIYEPATVVQKRSEKCDPDHTPK
jgi:hypothetical protein